MRHKPFFLALILCTGVFFALPAGADVPGATVDAVQKSAWLKRGNATFTMKPGMPVQSGDEINTGEDSRVYLKLHEGSIIKIGEYAKVQFELLQVPKKADDGFFAGAMKVMQGAFRFTSPDHGKRDMNIRVNAITLGVRGTDVWGKSDAQQKKDFVCLLQGKIEVSAGGASHVLDQYRQFFVVPHGKEPLPVGFVEEEKIGKWAMQTEIAKDK